MDVRLLGPLTVLDRSRQAIEIPGELPKALLAVLALASPTPVTSDRIVDALWGEEPTDSPEASLHSTVSRLRQAVGKDIIKHLADGYLLEIPVANSDLARFRRNLQRGGQFRTLGHPAKGAEAFRQALAQWRGRALPDVRRFEFAEAASRQLEEERLLAVEELMDTELLVGDHSMLLGELSGLARLFFLGPGSLRLPGSNPAPPRVRSASSIRSPLSPSSPMTSRSLANTSAPSPLPKASDRCLSTPYTRRCGHDRCATA